MSDEAPTQLPLPVGDGPPSSAPSQATATQPATSARWYVIATGAAGALVGIMVMLVLGRESSSTSKESPDGNAVRTESPTVVEHAPLPTWVGSRTASRTRDGSKTIGFELEARSDVPVWMTRMRPVLVVRCLVRTTEVFVVTGAASIERQSGVHTVRLQIDDEEPVLQQWVDSESSQELFAPNGVAFTKRLARAERLRFGFTPYNAAPVVADFVVHGFDKLAGLVASTCGWKLDPADAPKPQSARLN